jgi:methylated-DNA-[protein]-cysteine S-methyltransferase
MSGDLDCDDLLVFDSELGWISLIMCGDAVRQLSFGHESAKNAGAAIASGRAASRRLSPRQREVVEKLQRYAAGFPIDFSDQTIDFGAVSEFQLRVLMICQKIPYGETITYGGLAIAARNSGAARAVGNCMAGNRVPLIIPCHRVVRAGGQIGPYSAADGVATKRRLLELEGAKIGFSCENWTNTYQLG